MDINYNAFRIMQQAQDAKNRVATGFPSTEIKKALKKIGLKRTPGTNGEGREVVVEIGGVEYKVLATEI